MLGLPGRVLGLVGVTGPQCVWRRGARVVTRRPVRVHLKGEEKEAQEALHRYEEMLRGARRTSQGTVGQKIGAAKQESKAASASASDPEAALRNGIRHKLLSDAKEYERTLLEKVTSRKYRSEHQLFVAEGHRIIREALQHGATPKAVYFTRLKLVAALRTSPSKLTLQDVHALSNLPLIRAPYKTLQTWSSVTTSPGIVGVFKIPTAAPSPHTTASPTTPTTQPLTLVLDELREPGNLGGILRTAAAVGVTQVLLMKGCCDPWETKVVRAGCGAHFRLRLTSRLTWETLASHVPEDSQIFLADVCRSEDVAAGLDEDEEVEDEHPRARDRTDVKSFDSREEKVYEVDEKGNKVLVDVNYNDPEHLELYRHVQLPTLSYDRVGLRPTEGGAVLVIGGEVGVSNAAKKFVVDNFGSKVTIPLANGMDSLNVGVASGVILYEMQKQLHEMAIQREKRHETGG